MEGGGGGEVRVKASLVSATGPIFPSSAHALRSGVSLAASEADSGDQGRCTRARADPLAVQYAALSQEEEEELVALWRRVATWGGGAGGGEEDGEEGEEGEEELRAFARDVVLSAEERGALLQVLASAPSAGEWRRAVAMFWRRSNGHREEVLALEERRNVRKGDRIVAQNRRRKEAEAARRENEALLREWALQEKERAEQEKRQAKQAHELRTKRLESAQAAQEKSLQIIAAEDELLYGVYPSILRQRRWERAREGVLKAISSLHSAGAVSEAVESALAAGAEAYEGGPRRKDWRMQSAELMGMAALEYVRAAKRSASAGGRGGLGGGQERHWVGARSWFERQLDMLNKIHKDNADHPSIIACMADLRAARTGASSDAKAHENVE